MDFFKWTGIACALAIFLYVLGSIVIWSLKNGISPMPTSRKAKRCLLELLPKEIDGNVYELGSGWGTLVFSLARRYPHCRIVGYETSPVPFWFSRLRQMIVRLPNLQLQRRDFFQVPLGDASLLVCYLYPGAMRQLKVKLSEELKSRSWVVSNTFSIPGWKAEEIREVGDIYYSKIYLYRIEKE